MQKQYEDYIDAKETNAEHLRYEVLVKYIATISKISEDSFKELLLLIEFDEDNTMSLSICHYLVKRKLLNDSQWERLKKLMLKIGENSKKIFLIDLERKIDSNEFSEKEMINLLKEYPESYDSFAKNKFNESIEVMKVLQQSNLKKVKNYAKNRYNQLIKE